MRFESDHSKEAHVVAARLAEGDDNSGVERFSESDQIQILSMAASALCEQGQAARARELFARAIELAGSERAKDDPVNRALAVAGNNLACALEEKLGRSQAESDLMIMAAQAARKYWEIAGTWLQVERAEYRLSRTYLKAGYLERALEHAQACLSICRRNEAPALELFYAHEALALAEKIRGHQAGFTVATQGAKEHFERLSSEDRKWCEDSLRKLSA